MIKRITRLTVLITVPLFALAVRATEMPEKSDRAVPAVEEVMAVTHPCARMSGRRLDARASPFQASIDEYSAKYQVDSSIIKAVIAIESCYNERAESPMGAQGLMQLIPATAERFGVTDSFDSAQNIHGGTRYLGWLLKRYKGDLVKVFAAYNAGEGKVDRYDGVPPYKETRHYVHNVMTVYRKLSEGKSTVSLATTTANTLDRVIALAASKAYASPMAAPLPVAVAQSRRAITVIPAVATTLSARARLQQAGFIIGGPGVPIKPPPPAPVDIVQEAAVQDVMQEGGVAVFGPVEPVASVRVGHAISRPTSPAQLILAKAPSAQSLLTQPANAKRRVSAIFESPFQRLPPSKPGRAGWQINKAMAPQLYKQ